MAHWQNGELGQATTALQDALKVSSGFSLALQQLVRLSLAQNNTLNAQTYAQELVQKYPADPTNRELLAGVLGREGQIAQAEAQDLVAKQLAPSDPMAHIDLGMVYSAEKKWPEAQKEFESALELDPHNATALSQLTNFLSSRNEAPQALARIQQYVAANPNDENGQIILGLVNFQQKSYPAAETAFQRAVQLAPQKPAAYLQLGKTYQAEGKNDLAIGTYQQALALQPRFAGLSTMLGNLYLDKGDLSTAQKYYSEALASDPNFAVANANMAWVDAQQNKNLDVALSMAQKAKSEMPEVPSITDTLGWVLYKKGNYSGAIPLFEECVRKSPDSAEFHYHFGMTLLASGQRSKAKDQIEAALRGKLANDDAKEAHQALAQLD
jgi:tetratricopeptide (TPR) repeat protein